MTSDFVSASRLHTQKPVGSSPALFLEEILAYLASCPGGASAGAVAWALRCRNVAIFSVSMMASYLMHCDAVRLNRETGRFTAVQEASQ